MEIYILLVQDIPVGLAVTTWVFSTYFREVRFQFGRKVSQMDEKDFEWLKEWMSEILSYERYKSDWAIDYIIETATELHPPPLDKKTDGDS